MSVTTLEKRLLNKHDLLKDTLAAMHDSLYPIQNIPTAVLAMRISRDYRSSARSFNLHNFCLIELDIVEDGVTKVLFCKAYATDDDFCCVSIDQKRMKAMSFGFESWQHPLDYSDFAESFIHSLYISLHNYRFGLECIDFDLLEKPSKWRSLPDC